MARDVNTKALKRAVVVEGENRVPPPPSLSPLDFPNERLDKAERMYQFLNSYAQNGSIQLSLEEVDIDKKTLRNYLLNGRFQEQFFKVSGALRSLAIAEATHIMLNSESERLRLSAVELILKTTDEGSLPTPTTQTFNVNIIQAINLLKESPVGAEIFENTIGLIQGGGNSGGEGPEQPED